MPGLFIFLRFLALRGALSSLIYSLIYSLIESAMRPRDAEIIHHYFLLETLCCSLQLPKLLL